MQLDNKMKQSNLNVIGDLRQEFVTLLNARDQTREEKLRERDDRIYGKIGNLEGQINKSDEINDLRKELEKII